MLRVHVELLWARLAVLISVIPVTFPSNPQSETPRCPRKRAPPDENRPGCVLTKQRAQQP
jgi:hypothetical protein